METSEHLVSFCKVPTYILTKQFLTFHFHFRSGVPWSENVKLSSAFVNDAILTNNCFTID